MNLPTAISGIQLALRASIAAGLAFGLAQFLGLQHPVYAFTAAVIVTDIKPSESRALGLRRIIATIVGAICGALLTAVIPSPAGAWSIGFSILGAMLICHFLHATNAAKIAGYICAVVVLTHDGDPWQYAFYRSVETLLGVFVAWQVSFVPKLIRVEEPDPKE